MTAPVVHHGDGPLPQRVADAEREAALDAALSAFDLTPDAEREAHEERAEPLGYVVVDLSGDLEPWVASNSVAATMAAARRDVERYRRCPAASTIYVLCALIPVGTP